MSEEAHLPVTDTHGNVMVSLAAVAENDVRTDGPVPCPLALVVAASPDGVLFGMNRWRRQWELLGGIIEPGESPRQAAAREFTEESGMPVELAELTFTGVATFELVNPTRRELAAVFSARFDEAFAPQENEELTAFLWSDDSRPHSDMSTIDHAIARWVRAGTPSSSPINGLAE